MVDETGQKFVAISYVMQRTVSEIPAAKLKKTGLICLFVHHRQSQTLAVYSFEILGLPKFETK